MTAPCVIAEGTVFEAFDTAADWTANAYAYPPMLRPCSLVPGKNSLELTRKAATSVAAATFEKPISHTFSAGERACMVLDVWATSDFTNGKGSWAIVQLELSSTTDPSQTMSYATPQNLHNGWNRLFIGEDDWVAGGGELWSNTMICLRVSVTAATYACFPRVRFDRLRLGVQTKPTLVMRFDDSFASLCTIVKPKFDALGWVGTFDVVTDSVGTSGYLSAAQVGELLAVGWETTIYSKSHRVMPNTTIEDMRADIRGSMEWLAGHGYHGTPHYAYPRSSVDDRLLSVLRELGFLSGHLPYSGSLGAVYTGAPLVEPLEAEGAIVGGNTPLGMVKGWVDRSLQTGASLCLFFHDIGGSQEMSRADFAALCDHIRSRGITPLTVSDWYRFVSD